MAISVPRWHQSLKMLRIKISGHYKTLQKTITHQKHIIQEGFFHVILSNNSENSEPKPEFKLCTFQCGEFSIDNRCDKPVKKLQL